jgi:CBS domain-containing protein
MLALSAPLLMAVQPAVLPHGPLRAARAPVASRMTVRMFEADEESSGFLSFLKGDKSGVDVWPGASQLVSAHMTPASKLVTLDPEMNLKDAAVLLAEKGVTGAPVVEDGALVGVISQTDLLYKLAGKRSLLLRGSGPRSQRYADNTKRLTKIQGETVRCSMTPNPMSIRPSISMQDAAGAMLRNKHNRLMVTEEGQLAGIITSTDVVRLALCSSEEDCEPPP